MSAGWFFLEVLEENLFPCLCQLLEVPCIPLLAATSPIFKVNFLFSVSLCLCLSVSLSAFFVTSPVFLISLPFSHKDPCDYIAPFQLIQDNSCVSRFLITYAKSLLPHKLTSSQIPRIRMWTSLESYYSAYQTCLHIRPWAPQTFFQVLTFSYTDPL